MQSLFSFAISLDCGLFQISHIHMLQAALREAHEEAVQKSLAAFNDCAVGVGPTRKKYEGNLHRQLKKEFEV